MNPSIRYLTPEEESKVLYELAIKSFAESKVSPHSNTENWEEIFKMHKKVHKLAIDFLSDLDEVTFDNFERDGTLEANFLWRFVDARVANTPKTRRNSDKIKLLERTQQFFSSPGDNAEMLTKILNTLWTVFIFPFLPNVLC